MRSQTRGRWRVRLNDAAFAMGSHSCHWWFWMCTRAPLLMLNTSAVSLRRKAAT